MHGDKRSQQKHASTQARHPSYRWLLDVSIVINSALGICCMALVGYSCAIDPILTTLLLAFVILPIAFGVLAPAAVILLAMMICGWSALSWTKRIIAVLALTVGGIPPLVMLLIGLFDEYGY